MSLCDRLRVFRQVRRLSTAFIERRTGLSHFAVYRIENGLALPSLDNLETWANTLEITVSQLFFDVDAALLLPNLSARLSADEIVARKPR